MCRCLATDPPFPGLVALLLRGALLLHLRKSSRYIVLGTLLARECFPKGVCFEPWNLDPRLGIQVREVDRRNAVSPPWAREGSATRGRHNRFRGAPITSAKTLPTYFYSRHVVRGGKVEDGWGAFCIFNVLVGYNTSNSRAGKRQAWRST